VEEDAAAWLDAEEVSDAEGTDEDAALVGAETDSAEAQPSETSDPEVSILMVGDILLHTPVAESGKKEDGTYDFTSIFAQMKEEISGADLAIVNQEVIIGGEELGVSGYPAFNAPYELGDALADAGFDVVCHATNHALDRGEKGILNCLAFWRDSYPQIAVLGIYESAKEQSEIYVYEKEGIRIAVLNYTYGTNGIALPEDMPYAVNLLDEEQVKRDLEKANELADFVIVAPHWGTEYVLEETAQQQKWASFFAENGADLVIGTHPHVIEPIEWVDDTLVYYSTGNFVNWTSGTGEGTANRMVGAVAEVTVGMEDGEAQITDWGVEPVVCHVESGFGGVTVYPLSEYTEYLAEKNEIVKQDPAFSLEYCKELVRQVFGF
jgi:poly-gamma-glutamate synthesis protein (capsule biosynthesis protein)